MRHCQPTAGFAAAARCAAPFAVAPQRLHITPEQASRVATAFLEAPRHSARPTITAAYAELSNQCSRWFAWLTSGRVRRPIRVVFTHCREPYATAAHIAESVRREGLLELWPTQRDHDRRHPLLDSAVGGAYDRLRAVHDIVSHGSLGHDFDADGEYSAWLSEDQMYTGLARWALATELHGEHSVLWTSGTLADHKAVLLDPALLSASRTPPTLHAGVPGHRGARASTHRPHATTRRSRRPCASL